jgi:sec-independent protein translocase protein TatC
MTDSSTIHSKQSKQFNPDHYRMTIGEHLEELRLRLVLGLGVFFVAVFVCMGLKNPVMQFFLRPLMIALAANKMSPQVNFAEIGEAFTTYIEVSLIVAAAFSSPWLLYQIWQFVAAGLYPRERKYVTKYLPLSITLLITGMIFLYLVVLPLMMEFFLAFNFGPAFAVSKAEIDSAATTQPAVVVPFYNGDPVHPLEGQIWMDRTQERLKFFYRGEIRSLQFGSEALANPIIMLSTYIDMVVNMLMSFGLAFQMPLIVLALVRIGIVDVPQLKRMRRAVYFCITVIAAFIVPDVVTGMVALMLPLIFLFELGLWLARHNPESVPTDNVG